jgi:hypothetical protein
MTRRGHVPDLISEVSQLLDNPQEKIKRPAWVWVISVIYFVGAGYALLLFYVIGSGNVQLNSAQQAYFDSLTVMDHVAAIAIGSANMLGAVLLFLLRKPAFYLFVGTFCAGILVAVWETITTNWVEAMPAGGLVGSAIGWAISLVVCMYCWRLIQRGVLK